MIKELNNKKDIKEKRTNQKGRKRPITKTSIKTKRPRLKDNKI